jgi:fluorothreonine transaldolase
MNDASRPSVEETSLALAELAQRIATEEARAQSTLHLTANENVLSPLAREVLSSPLANRYLLEHLEMRQGSPSRLGNLLFRGLDDVAAIEASATEVARRMFSADYVDFRPVSGLHAMQTTLAALTAPGDRVMRIATKDGGNMLTELLCRSAGRQSCAYVFDGIGEIDLDRTRALLEAERPALLYLDAMNHLFPFPVAELKEIAGDVPLVYDASHTLGLIAGGQFQDPLGEGADIVQASTHHSFFGPQKGIVLGNDRALMERVSCTLSSGLVGSQHTAPTLSLFVALHEMHEHGRRYGARVIENARLLAAALDRRGIPVVAADCGFTQSHMLFVDARPLDSGLLLMGRLLRAGISTNRVIAFENVEALRIGVQEVTRLGFDHGEMELIADWIAALLRDEADPDAIRPMVSELARSHDTVYYCGDSTAPADLPDVSSPSNGATSIGRRWARTRLTRQEERAAAGTPALEQAQSLGGIASTFEHQTDSAGNISFQVDGRTFVTASGAYIKGLRSRDFVELTGYDGDTLHCVGLGQPSAEAYMHYLIQDAVGGAFVVHNHFIPLGDLSPDVVVLPPQEYGSIELAEAVSDAVHRSRLIYVRRHGLVFWGESHDECRALIEECWRATGQTRSAPDVQTSGTSGAIA